MKPLMALSIVTAILFAGLVGTSVIADTTYTVNSTADTNDGKCDDRTGNSPKDCTLREAIEAANANAGADVIAFNISGGGVHTIQPRSALPAIVDPVTIDGTTQPGYTAGSLVIELDGTSAGAGVHGLSIISGGDGTTIRGLVINRFSANGIDINSSGGNTIQNNYIGTDATATVGLGNGGRGLSILSAPGSTIDANVLSANGSFGLLMQSSSNGLVQNNYVGTDPTETINLGSLNSSGLLILLESNKNTVTNNFIAFNEGNGISLGSSENNTIEFNTIVDNGFDGIGVGWRDK